MPTGKVCAICTVYSVHYTLHYTTGDITTGGYRQRETLHYYKSVKGIDISVTNSIRLNDLTYISRRKWYWYSAVQYSKLSYSTVQYIVYICGVTEKGKINLTSSWLLKFIF